MNRNPDIVIMVNNIALTTKPIEVPGAMALSTPAWATYGLFSSFACSSITV